MKYKHLKLESQNDIGLLTICREEALNALNTELLLEINQILDEIRDDMNIKVLILTGSGKAFVAGADISEMKAMTAMKARSFSRLGMDVFRKLELMEKPVIAAINGFALGGGLELALACDIRIASKKAKFGQPEVGLGITPGFGGTQRLARLIGPAKAKEYIFTGMMIHADEAETFGLVNRVYEVGVLLQEASNLAEKIASQGQIAVRLAKASINRGLEMSIENGLSMEQELFAMCFSTADQVEGMSAFLEKRSAVFKER